MSTNGNGKHSSGFGSRKYISRAELEKLKRKGMTEIEIAEKLGCARSHVTKFTMLYGLQGLARHYGIARGGSSSSPINIPRAELKAKREKGWKLHDIARHYGCGVNHVSVLIRRYDLPKSNAGRPTERR